MIAYHGIEPRDVWIAYDSQGYIVAAFFDEIKARNFVYRQTGSLRLICDNLPAPKLVVCTEPVSTPHSGDGFRNARKPL